jgi:hypothetical protein
MGDINEDSIPVELLRVFGFDSFSKDFFHLQSDFSLFQKIITGRIPFIKGSPPVNLDNLKFGKGIYFTGK